MEQRLTACGSVYGQDDIAKDCTLKQSKIPYIGLADPKLYVFCFAYGQTLAQYLRWMLL